MRTVIMLAAVGFSLLNPNIATAHERGHPNGLRNYQRYYWYWYPSWSFIERNAWVNPAHFRW